MTTNGATHAGSSTWSSSSLRASDHAAGAMRAPGRSAALARGVVGEAMRVLGRHLLVDLPAPLDRMLCQAQQPVGLVRVRLEERAEAQLLEAVLLEGDTGSGRIE